MTEKEIEYTIALPATRLIGDEIIDLEQVLKANVRNETLTYEIIDGNTVYTFNSATELLSDPTVPDFIREFWISLECDAGVLEIDSTTESINDPIQLVITGKPDWVRSKRAEVRDFFSAKQDRLRTFVEGSFRLELAIAAILGAALYFLQWTGYAASYGVTSQEDINRIVFFGAMTTLFSRSIFNRLYPYSLLILNPDKELYPFLQRLAYLIMLVAAIIAINGWLMT
ncbi:hypothetical protein [Haloarcula sp. K1]|uniref:hypothetical protein n=1 Tax=Haloarcula sp. K1 TaxID=1622207 RepID=UPI0007BB5522|nr:hypothetical protein [Haloarcula sp. K1]KZX49710.1 hypothetical protein AV929_18590 [Haloarcula sp. K1]